MVIEVWADLARLWCRVGKDRLRRAITQRADADRFEVRLRLFELNPDAPGERRAGRFFEADLASTHDA